GPAVVAQTLASVIQDVASHKPAWRIRFNVGQYILSMVTAYLVLHVLTDASRMGSSHPFAGSQLPAVLLSASAFFVVNTGLVGVAAALYQRVPLRRYFQQDLSFVITTSGALP